MRTLLTNSGTGKIYASALAMRELGFKRVLFLVHRVTLAKQAKKSFEKVFDKKVTDEEFNQLTSDERVRHVIEQSEYYGYSGDRVRGLIFCSRVKECEEL